LIEGIENERRYRNVSGILSAKKLTRKFGAKYDIVTYDSMIIKTNSSLTYESLLIIAKRVVNVLRSNLQPKFNFNIRYHYRNPKNQNAAKYMKKVINESFLDGVLDDVSLHGASFSKSIQQKEFSWHSDINLSMCRRESAKRELIHIFFRNLLDISEPGFKVKGKEGQSTISKFIRLDNELANVMKHCETIGNDMAKRYF